jgi:hypothetical protein
MINAGTLLVNGAGSTASDSAVAVNNSGTVLGGTGRIEGAVTVNSGATLRGGTGDAASGALTLANTVNTSAGIIQLALGAAGAHSSLASTNGTWSFGENQQFNFINLGAEATTYSGIITGLSADPGTTGSWVITNEGWAGTFSYNPGAFEGSGFGSIDVTFSAVPEPSTWAAGCLTVAALGFSRRKSLAKLLQRIRSRTV